MPVRPQAISRTDVDVLSIVSLDTIFSGLQNFSVMLMPISFSCQWLSISWSYHNAPNNNYNGQSDITKLQYTWLTFSLRFDVICHSAITKTHRQVQRETMKNKMVNVFMYFPPRNVAYLLWIFIRNCEYIKWKKYSYLKNTFIFKHDAFLSV